MGLSSKRFKIRYLCGYLLKNTNILSSIHGNVSFLTVNPKRLHFIHEDKLSDLTFQSSWTIHTKHLVIMVKS